MKLVFTADNPGGTFYQNFYMERAKDASLPLWLRIASLAYANYRGNRHAYFGPGTLVEFFGRKSSQLKPEVDRAVAYGFLASSSNLCCLVVPDAFGGGTGRSDDACPDSKHRLTRRCS